MPLAKDVGRSFRILELSLCAQMKQLAATILDFATDLDREKNAVLACRIMAGRFPDFTTEELMWHLCWHINRIEYDRVAKELCEFADGAKMLADEQKQEIHVLLMDLAQARKDLTAYAQGNIRIESDKGYSPNPNANAIKKPRKPRK
jgi:hypothetical protein